MEDIAVACAVPVIIIVGLRQWLKLKDEVRERMDFRRLAHRAPDEEEGEDAVVLELVREAGK